MYVQLKEDLGRKFVIVNVTNPETGHLEAKEIFVGKWLQVPDWVVSQLKEKEDSDIFIISDILGNPRQIKENKCVSLADYSPETSVDLTPKEVEPKGETFEDVQDEIFEKTEETKKEIAEAEEVELKVIDEEPELEIQEEAKPIKESVEDEVVEPDSEHRYTSKELFTLVKNEQIELLEKLGCTDIPRYEQERVHLILKLSQKE